MLSTIIPLLATSAWRSTLPAVGLSLPRSFPVIVPFHYHLTIVVTLITPQLTRMTQLSQDIH